MGTFTNIISYVILGLSILFTLAWCLRIREKAKSEQATEKSMELQGFLMTASVVLVPLLHLSYFHLLWMIPASFVLGLLSMATPLKLLWIFSSMYFAFWYIGISNEGRKYYVAGEYDKAIAAFKEEIKKKPTSAELYFNLGLAYGKNGQQENEIDAYKRALKLNPIRPELHFNLGTVYNDTGNKEQAIGALNEAIRLRPEYLKAHYTLCKIYIETGDNENGRKELEIVKKLNGSIPEELASALRIG
jgi:tetratricopeptide (TPR) repeat protein